MKAGRRGILAFYTSRGIGKVSTSKIIGDYNKRDSRIGIYKTKANVLVYVMDIDCPFFSFYYNRII